jgi:hypothetical protein
VPLMRVLEYDIEPSIVGAPAVAHNGKLKIRIVRPRGWLEQ